MMDKKEKEVQPQRTQSNTKEEGKEGLFSIFSSLRVPSCPSWLKILLDKL
jgi:hypothetical protein